MTLELNAADDFATIVDGGEAITLKRKGSATTIAVAAARRLSSRTSEAEPSGGHVAQADVEWQFPWDGATDPPRLGDAHVDAAGECFTILAVENRPLTGRVRCTTRNLRLVYQLDDRIDVQQAVWDDPGGGPEIVGWNTLRAALPARIQPDRTEFDNTTTPPTATATYRILVGEPLDLPPDARFVDRLGNVYQLLEVTQAERIDALVVARVIRLPSA
jgi:hypothetical protein